MILLPEYRQETLPPPRPLLRLLRFPICDRLLRRDSRHRGARQRRAKRRLRGGLR